MELRTPGGQRLRIERRKDGWVGAVEERRGARRSELLLYEGESRLRDLIAKLALARPDAPWVVDAAERVERETAAGGKR